MQEAPENPISILDPKHLLRHMHISCNKDGGPRVLLIHATRACPQLSLPNAGARSKVSDILGNLAAAIDWALPSLATGRELSVTMRMQLCSTPHLALKHTNSGDNPHLVLPPEGGERGQAASDISGAQVPLPSVSLPKRSRLSLLHTHSTIPFTTEHLKL